MDAMRNAFLDAEFDEHISIARDRDAAVVTYKHFHSRHRIVGAPEHKGGATEPCAPDFETFPSKETADGH